MGLFSKSKEEIPAPPVMPPVPEEDSTNMSSNIASPASAINDGLAAPPVPGGNLDDIKQQVQSSGVSQNSMESTNNMPSVSTESTLNIPQMPNTSELSSESPDMAEESNIANKNEESNSTIDDDSLFDFSELDLSNAQNQETEISENSINKEKEDENISIDNLSFIQKNKNSKEYEDFFITTKQFKTLLEIVEAVKNKVKGANETHLRLMDIKAEEDIEYENLRKDFEFIEDKLYEVDNLIFDKH